MRKFTKEIAALLASAAIGTGVAGVGEFSASSEEIVRTAGVAANQDTTTCTTARISADKKTMSPDTKTTDDEFTPLDGFMASPDEEELPPTVGEEIPPDELIGTTTATSPTMPVIVTDVTPVTSITTIPPLAGIMAPTLATTIPPLAGVPMPPDDTIPLPTEPTTLPPLAGDVMPLPLDGDVNIDGSFNMADLVLFQRWLLNDPDANLAYWRNADLNKDGKLNVFDLRMMKKALIEKKHEVASDFYFSVTGYSNELLKLDCDDNLEAVITSTSELSDYIEQVYPNKEDQGLDSMKSEFNEDFFENNVLLLKPIYLPSTGYNYSIDNVSYNKNKLIIDYTCKLDGLGCCIVNGLHGVVIIPKENYYADSIEWRLTTIDPYGIKSGYIAVFNGEDDNTIHKTYVYKLDNGSANYGFAYINADTNPKTWFTKVTEQGEVNWTDDVFKIAEKNNAYDYVTLPGDETKYTIDEFMAKFLMN